MKIVTNDEVFIQGRDIALLTNGYLKLPISIIDKISGLEVDKDEYISFSSPHEIKFINKLNCLIDYNSIANLSLEELEKLNRKLLLEKDTIEIIYDETESPDKKAELKWQIKSVIHKIETVNKLIEYKKSGKKIPLPEDLGDQNRPIEGIEPRGFVKKLRS